MIKTNYPGVRAYKHKASGNITYYAVIKKGNSISWVKVGTKAEGITPRKAFDYKNTIQVQARTNRHNKDIRHITLDDIATIYFKWNVLIKTNTNSKLMYKKHIKDRIGARKITELGSNDLYNLLDTKLSSGLSVGSVNLIAKLTKRIINFAITESIIRVDPFKNFKFIKNDNRRVRYLDAKEIVLLLEEIENNSQLYLFVKIALITGARARSILEIRKKDINLKQQSIILQDFKRGNRYTAYFNDDLLELLTKRLSNIEDNSRVVVCKYSKIYYKLSRVFNNLFNKELEKSDRVNRVVIHTLRHTFASHLALNGVSVQKIQKLLNHADIRQTIRYAKLSGDSGKEEVFNLYE